MAMKDYELWLEKTTGELNDELRLIGGDTAAIEMRFGGALEFGTGGLRGILGAGTARMNIHTVGVATQGFADLLAESKKSCSVAIAWDSRNYSAIFAQRTAEVFAANGIKVYIYKELMPTPALSFAVRRLGCDAGVMVTASHNPAAYNGYKAYGADGGQLTPQTAQKIYDNTQKLNCFADVKLLPFELGKTQGMIQVISDAVTEEYLNCVMALSLSDDVEAHKALKVVYSPLNGAGLSCVTQVLRRKGFSDVTLVEEQREPDGNFPTCPYPNPETKEAMALGMELSKKLNADILLATDPDCDRVGLAVKSAEGYTLVNGNQMGGLILDYICMKRTQAGTMPVNPVIVKSIVSSDLADSIAKGYGGYVKTVLTGFKYIGEIITELQQQGKESDFLLGFEESHGYLSGAHVRDKDAVNAAMLLCEMAACYKKQGKTILERLNELYEKYGYCYTGGASYSFEGARPMEAMGALMDTLRKSPFTEAAGMKVTAFGDFEKQVEVVDGKPQPTGLPQANMLRFTFGEQGWAIVRPSGTEPKLKLYLNIRAKTREEASALAQKVQTDMEKVLH